MRGVCGLGGWQWLFLVGSGPGSEKLEEPRRRYTNPHQIEGMFTVVVGIIFITLFPLQTSNPVPLLGFRYFNERETYILTRRVLLDDPSKIHARPHISWKEVKAAVSTSRLPVPRLSDFLTCVR